MRGLGTDHVISATATEKIVSMHGNIRRTGFDQKSPQPPEESVLNCHRHIDRHTDRQMDIATSKNLFLQNIHDLDICK